MRVRNSFQNAEQQAPVFLSQMNYASNRDFGWRKMSAWKRHASSLSSRMRDLDRQNT